MKALWDRLLARLPIERDRLYEIISYLFFGVLTTIVNYVAYWAFTRTLGMSVAVATFWAWALAVLFAFVTNKIWVFHSHTNTVRAFFTELTAFVAARVFSGALDVALMWLFADKMGLPDMWVKLALNVLVTVLNYIFSKLWIFKK